MSELTPIDDELLSAYLDDEVTTPERAIIEADADAMARVVQLRSVRDAVAAPVMPLIATDRDRLLEAALAASDTSPTVTSLTVARTQRARSWRPLIAVAAAVAVIGLAVPVIRNLELGGDAGDSAATSIAADEAASDPDAGEPNASFASGGDDATDGGAAEAEMATEAPASGADADMAEEPEEEPADEAALSVVTEQGQADASRGIGFDPLVPDLGEFESIDLLIDRVLADYAVWLGGAGLGYVRAGAETVPADAECLDDLDLADNDLTDLLDGQAGDQASATIDGIGQVIWLFDDGTVYVASIADCAPIIVANYFEG